MTYRCNTQKEEVMALRSTRNALGVVCSWCLLTPQRAGTRVSGEQHCTTGRQFTESINKQNPHIHVQLTLFSAQ